MAKKEIEKVEGQKEICFAIMPFGGRFDEYYKEIYCSAIRKITFEITKIYN